MSADQAEASAGKADGPRAAAAPDGGGGPPLPGTAADSAAVDVKGDAPDAPPAAGALAPDRSALKGSAAGPKSASSLSVRSTMSKSATQVWASMRDSGVASMFSGEGVKWQWEHRSGFRDYAAQESARIERHFQAGEWIMRMKSGMGKNAKPREVYFYDMEQFDPGSGSTRKIRRVPALSRFANASRRLSTIWTSFLKSEPQWWSPKDMSWYAKQREAMGELGLDGQNRRIESIWYRITESWQFSILATFAVVLNAGWLVIDDYENQGTTNLDTAVGFIVVENLFCLWFSIELFLRLMSFKRVCFLWRDGWVVLDLFLVATMVLETWVLQIGLVLVFKAQGAPPTTGNFGALRTIRLLRLGRVTRLFAFFPELLVLVKGLLQAVKSLAYTMLLILLLLFSFGVLLANLAQTEGVLKDNMEVLEAKKMGLGTIGQSMWTLLKYGLFMDAVGDFLQSLSEVHWFYCMLVIIFIFLSNLTMLNMLIGVLCEVVSRVTAQETDVTSREDLRDALLDILECYDVEDDQHIHKAEFDLMMGNPDLQVILRNHDINMSDLMKLQDVLFEENQQNDDEWEPGAPKRYAELSFDSFLEKVFQLRGGNMSTVTDIVEMRGYLRRNFDRLEEKMQEVRHASRSASRPPSRAGLGSPAGPAPALDAAIAACVPGQVFTAAPAAADQSFAFKAQLMAQLADIKSGQDELRNEVCQLKDKVREVEDHVVSLGSQASPAPDAGEQSC